LKHLSKDNKTVTLSKFDGLNPVSEKRSPADKLAVVVDVETTGLSADRDRVIQLAIRPFYYSEESFSVTGVAKKIVFFNDPGEPIREEITKITGITDEDVKGHSIDWEWVKGALERPEFVISHNAKFDRSFIESELALAGLTHLQDSIWCCSLKQVDWSTISPFKVPSKALEVLCAWTGFFYDSHQADADIDALLHLLREQSKLEELIKNGSSPEYRVYAVNSPRELNSELKRRWFRWDPNLVQWWKAFDAEEAADEECEWLSENITGCEPQKFELEAKYRYSSD